MDKSAAVLREHYTLLVAKWTRDLIEETDERARQSLIDDIAWAQQKLAAVSDDPVSQPADVAADDMDTSLVIPFG